jgi:hypothetical protein
LEVLNMLSPDKDEAMTRAGIATPAQLVTLSEILEAYCALRGVVSAVERDDIAASILQLFDRGVSSANEMTRALDEQRNLPAHAHTKILGKQRFS